MSILRTVAVAALIAPLISESQAAPDQCITCRSRAADRDGSYRARVYDGWYARWPYNYRVDYDYPWHAGPSRAHWPIDPPHGNMVDVLGPGLSEPRDLGEPIVDPPLELLPMGAPPGRTKAPARVRRSVPVRRASVFEGQQR